MGGAPPHTVTLLKNGQNFPFAAAADDSSKFTLAVDPTVCPAGGAYQVTGSIVGTSTPLSVTFTEDELADTNWTACGTGDGDTEAVDEPAGQLQSDNTPAASPT